MLSTESISKTQSTESSMTSFPGSKNERPFSQVISMVESTLQVTEFRSMERTKSHASVLQIGMPDGSSDDVVEKKPLASSSSKSIRPTPLDFAHFLPWLCVEWQSPQFVAVASVVQEEYVSVLQSKASKASSKIKTKRKITVPKTSEDNISLIISRLSQTSLVDVPLIVTAVFNSKSYLVEVAITERDVEIHRKTIQAINVCTPFHCFLTRLTLRWATLDNILIYEIAKFLPNSYLTDIILDDTPGRPNYDVLLSQESPLRYLSLNRCLIDDDICKKIAANIAFGAGGVNLNVLELGSNLITDVGALAIAESLRLNRNLMHLNLSGNMVTDLGAISLLSHLMKFRVRLDELTEAKKRKVLYVQKKLKVYQFCHKEVVLRRQPDEHLKRRSTQVNKTDGKGNKKQRRGITDDDGKDDHDEATELTLQRIGEFLDPFDERSTIIENESVYCTGNVVLCSLNLAYNQLSYISLQKIYEVLKYQNETMESEGLKRIVFVGNPLPVDSALYFEITNYLERNVSVAFQKNRPTKEKSSRLTKASRIKLA